MSNAFTKAIEFTLPWEAGRGKDGNVRADGGLNTDQWGGITKWGIAQKYHPNVVVSDLGLADALAIYQREYWDIYSTRTPALDLDAIKLPYAVAIFDSGVNCGVGRTYAWHLTATKAKDPVKSLLGLRQDFYTQRSMVAGPDYPLKGLLNRLNDLKKYVEILAQS